MRPHGEMFGRDEQSHQQWALLPLQVPEDVARPDGMDRAAGRFFGRGLRPAPQPAVAGYSESRKIQVGLGARVGAGCPLRGRRREELQHPQWLGAVVEGVMPGVAAEKGGLTGLQSLHFAGPGIGDHQRPAQHVVDDVGGEDRSERIRSGEMRPPAAARRRADGCGRWRHRSSPRLRPPLRRPRDGG